jgi:DNA-binding Lrp family transcriptional regulator
MTELTIASPLRRPRFRRASEPPAFRLTKDDVIIIRQLAQHRFLRSIHIAALVGRSIDRTNDRLQRLFHAGYIDRPRAQLDYYATSGSAPIVYALAGRGARLLIERDGIEFANVEWSRKNREAGRPFIEHQIELMNFFVALECAVRERSDVCLIRPVELSAEFPNQPFSGRNQFRLRAAFVQDGISHRVSVVPDLAFGLKFTDGSRRCFMVEIDRGTMPIVRSDIRQTSFERKMRTYIGAHSARQHEKQFGWKNFRVLTVTTDEHRMNSMMEALRALGSSGSAGTLLFMFATRRELLSCDPLAYRWQDARGQAARLVP